jgi:hypothetical protein
MKILILSHPRSGSSYLANLFKNCDENFYLVFEPFSRKVMKKYSSAYVKKIINTVQSKNYQNLICKEHFCKINEHILHENLKNKFLDINWYIIGLLRKDIVQAEISEYIAEEIKWWSYTNYDNTLRKIYIKPSKFLNQLQLKIQRIEKFLAWNNQFKKVNEFVFFEDLKFNYKDDYQNLNLSKRLPLTFNKQKIPDTIMSPLKEKMVINYDEIKKLGDQAIGQYQWKNSWKNLK